jgi:hypothetical protein
MTRIAFQMAWIDLLVFIMISPRNNLKARLQSYCALEMCCRLTGLRPEGVLRLALWVPAQLRGSSEAVQLEKD